MGTDTDVDQPLRNTNTWTEEHEAMIRALKNLKARIEKNSEDKVEDGDAESTYPRPQEEENQEQNVENEELQGEEARKKQENKIPTERQEKKKDDKL